MSALGFKSDGLKELWSRLRFVLLALIIYRIGTHIPVPGIDPVKISSLFDQNQGTLLGLFNMFSGGALERMSIMALNVVPYITAAIVMNLLEATTPSLKKMFRQEGEQGRRKRTHYVRLGTLLLAIFQSMGFCDCSFFSRNGNRPWYHVHFYCGGLFRYRHNVFSLAWRASK